MGFSCATSYHKSDLLLKTCISLVPLETVESIKTVSFGTSSIQKARRVALHQHLLDTLRLQEGDTVTIELDVQTATILIRKNEADLRQRSGVRGKPRA